MLLALGFLKTFADRRLQSYYGLLNMVMQHYSDIKDKFFKFTGVCYQLEQRLINVHTYI